MLFSASLVHGPSASEVNRFVASMQVFFSPLYCCLSSLKCYLYLWTCSLAWRHHLFSKSSIVSWPQAHQEGCMYVCLFVTGLWLKYTSFTYSLRTLQHVLLSMVPMIRHRLLLSTQRSICLGYCRESQLLVKKSKRITVEPSNRRIKSWRRDRLASFSGRETAWYQLCSCTIIPRKTYRFIYAWKLLVKYVRYISMVIKKIYGYQTVATSQSRHCTGHTPQAVKFFKMRKHLSLKD